ncbi:MAG: hypothetical protein U9Q90_08940 [Campylobacterota bacterium]|nr:hypothetical protein [Campylobacterota bacterium]
MIKVFVGSALLVVFVSTLAHAEPSVYGSSSSSSRSSGGSLAGKNRNEIAVLKQRIRTLDERVDGLTTVIEGLNATINDLRQSQGTTATGVTSGETEARLNELEAKIDSINAGNVSKIESKKASVTVKSTVTAKNKSTASKPKETTTGSKKNKSSTGSSLSGKSPSQLYSEGVRLFLKQKYTEAQKRFTITESKGYKPAASSYYLGEIAYYSKKYDDAIFYFKKSAGLYDQASYIDTLLLHTAISLEKNGDKSQAKLFYETIIENYPEKKNAKIAKENLKKL